MPIPLAAGAVSAKPYRDLMADLGRLLTDEGTVYMCLEPTGAILSIKSPEMVAFGKALVTEWVRLSPQERAEKVVDWIRKAASYCRNPRIRWAPPAGGEPEKEGE